MKRLQREGYVTRSLILWALSFVFSLSLFLPIVIVLLKALVCDHSRNIPCWGSEHISMAIFSGLTVVPFVFTALRAQRANGDIILFCNIDKTGANLQAQTDSGGAEQQSSMRLPTRVGSSMRQTTLIRSVSSATRALGRRPSSFPHYLRMSSSTPHHLRKSRKHGYTFFSLRVNNRGENVIQKTHLFARERVYSTGKSCTDKATIAAVDVAMPALKFILAAVSVFTKNNMLAVCIACTICCGMNTILSSLQPKYHRTNINRLRLSINTAVLWFNVLALIVASQAEALTTRVVSTRLGVMVAKMREREMETGRKRRERR
jgi:hypothetical protein